MYLSFDLVIYASYPIPRFNTVCEKTAISPQHYLATESDNKVYKVRGK